MSEEDGQSGRNVRTDSPRTRQQRSDTVENKEDDQITPGQRQTPQQAGCQQNEPDNPRSQRQTPDQPGDLAASPVHDTVNISDRNPRRPNLSLQIGRAEPLTAYRTDTVGASPLITPPPQFQDSPVFERSFVTGVFTQVQHLRAINESSTETESELDSSLMPRNDDRRTVNTSTALIRTDVHVCTQRSVTLLTVENRSGDDTSCESAFSDAENRRVRNTRDAHLVLMNESTTETEGEFSSSLGPQSHESRLDNLPRPAVCAGVSTQSSGARLDVENASGYDSSNTSDSALSDSAHRRFGITENLAVFNRSDTDSSTDSTPSRPVSLPSLTTPTDDPAASRKMEGSVLSPIPEGEVIDEMNASVADVQTELKRTVLPERSLDDHTSPNTGESPVDSSVSSPSQEKGPDGEQTAAKTAKKSRKQTHFQKTIGDQARDEFSSATSLSSSSGRQHEKTDTKRTKRHKGKKKQLKRSLSSGSSYKDSSWASETASSSLESLLDATPRKTNAAYLSSVTLQKSKWMEGVQILEQRLRPQGFLQYGAMAVEEIVRDLACCERRSAQHECLRQLLLVDKLPCSLRELDTRTMVECLKARDPVIRGRSVCCLEQMLLDHRVHKKPTEELMHVITTAYTVIETVDDDDIYRYCNLLMTAMCALACHAKHAGTSDQLQKDLETLHKALTKLSKGYVRNDSFHPLKGVTLFLKSLPQVLTSRTVYHEEDWAHALHRSKMKKRNFNLSHGNFAQLTVRCYSIVCGMLQAGWKHLMEKLVEEMRRVLRALAKLQVDQDSSAAFDLFLVRCLVLVLTTCFSDDHQEVSQRQCNSPKVVAELLRNVLMLASSRIEHLVEEEIDCLICHPSKHVRDVLTELMTRKSLPLLDLSTSYAEKRLEVIGVHAEVNDDVRPPAGDATGSKKRQACMWRELEWSGRQGERLQGAIYLPQNKCLVSSTVTHCVKHSSPKHHSQQHVQHLDMLLRFGSHPYFLTLLAFQLRPMPCFYITEDASECRLLSLLLDRRVSQRWIQPAPLLMAALDIIYAIRFLAEEHIALRDITTYNMVYAVKGEGEDVGITVKLADLGLSHEYCAETDTYQSQEVRPQRDPGPIPVRWTAREALFEGLYSDRSMIYSFGYVLYELFTHGCQPYSEISRRSTDDILRLLFLRSKSVRPFHWPCLPDGVYSLIRKCTSLRPKDRPTLDEVETALKQLLQKSKDGEQSKERSGTTRPWSQCEDYPPINPAQERRKHAPERGIPPIVHQLLKGDADNYKNLQEYSWAASSSLRVKETELMTSDPITIPPAGESSFICVEEWLTPDFVGNQLPRLESNRAVLPGVVAWAQNRLSPYPDHAVHERQYTRAVTLLHAARRLCRDPLDYAPVAAMVNACLQLTKVVCEIHEQGWLHRDIRASNVLVECGTDQASQEDKVLLARIGRMVYLAGADYVRGEVFTGSRRWMAPEVLHTGIYTKENDVFMLGTTFWEIWNARNVCARDPTATERHLVPLAYVRQKDVENMVQEGVLLPDLPEMPSWLYTLICQCRHPDRKERPSIRDVLFQLEKNSTGYANTISTILQHIPEMTTQEPDGRAPPLPLRARIGSFFRTFTRKRRKTNRPAFPLYQDFASNTHLYYESARSEGYLRPQPPLIYQEDVSLYMYDTQGEENKYETTTFRPKQQKYSKLKTATHWRVLPKFIRKKLEQRQERLLAEGAMYALGYQDPELTLTATHLVETNAENVYDSCTETYDDVPQLQAPPRPLPHTVGATAPSNLTLADSEQGYSYPDEIYEEADITSTSPSVETSARRAAERQRKNFPPLPPLPSTGRRQMPPPVLNVRTEEYEEPSLPPAHLKGHVTVHRSALGQASPCDKEMPRPLPPLPVQADVTSVHYVETAQDENVNGEPQDSDGHQQESYPAEYIDCRSPTSYTDADCKESEKNDDLESPSG